ncbi:long-chain fatty acid--CoA ligase [Microbacterium sp. W1N]|uniref:AMP-dependent synthetase/ligase n=1 Tax=Microbacterium festucae TaxID=2977531 RepID=UPI0021C245B7|nr:long-chain fatty acid--CoA ligase [Microbacterium festucae]MCT9821447.1 long-chain fatty acid--CoA ligase [Microbacterium festucae]
MREHSTPLSTTVDDHRNITDLLTRRAAAAPEHGAFDVPSGQGWRVVTTAQFLTEVQRLAKGLIATGIRPGERLAIMAPTRYEWALVDLAAWFAGAVVVPVYDTSSPAQVAAIVADADVRLAVGGTPEQTRVLTDAFAATGTGSLGVWRMSGDVDDSTTADAVTAGATPTLADLAARADEIDDAQLEARRTTAGLDSPATIVYTSGTTGEPKGAVLTHRNFLGQVLNIAAAYGEVVHPRGNTIIFLPLAHVLARGLQLICLASGMRIAHLSDPTAVVGSLGVLRPTFLVVVPRVLQKIQAAAGQKAAAARLSRVWDAAVRTAEEWGRRAEQPTGAMPTALRLRHALFDRLFYRRLRAIMGGRVDYVLSGGARLDPELSLFFRGIGVPVIEGYGLTETTAPLTGNLPGRIRSGTVGPPLPGSTVRISDDGEVLARGIGVFGGYRDPQHDADAFVDGFFRTGDLGRLDDEGNLIIEGRLKDVIVTSNGKTVVPATWEFAVEENPLIAHAVMVGEGRSYLSALLLLDPDAVTEWALAEGVTLSHAAGTELAEVVDERLRARIQASVDAANALVARSERVRRFTLVSADLDTTLLTPTLKIKRRVVLERGSAAVENLYR